MKMNRKKNVEGLEHFESENAPWLILIHGYGADAPDLFSLKDYFQFSKPINWFCPRAPLQVPIGPGWTGRAWWKIDMREIELAAQTGQERNLSETRPPNLDELRTKLMEAIELCGGPKNVIIGGFSQGAMLASDIFLSSPEPFKGLVLLSGSLINKTELKSLAAKKSGADFFQSHGKSDQVLSINGAHRLYNFLNEAGMKGELVQFTGGHEIPQEVILRAQKYIESKL